MASDTSAGLYEWLVFIPTTPGTEQLKVQLRPEHMEAVPEKISSGFMGFGGATLSEQLTPEEIANGTAPKKNGSFFKARANSIQEIKDRLANDNYVTNGIWDLENAKYIPFLTSAVFANYGPLDSPK